MKILIILIAGLMVVGCGGGVSFTEKDIVGIYEYEVVDFRKVRRKSRKDGGGSTSPMKKIKIYFREDGSTSSAGRWKIVGKEVHVFYEDKTNKIGNQVFVSQSKTDVYKRFLDGHSSIDGHLTLIANIKDGKRTDYPKEKQTTSKRIK